MKKAVKFIIACLFSYILLLVALVLSENAAQDATIHTFQDAFWFSLSVMTTIHFSEAVPVTSSGRAISIFFPAISIAVIAFAIIVGLRYYASSLYPCIKLWKNRTKTWYVFSNDCLDARALARDLSRAEPRGLVIFLNRNGKLPADRDWLYYQVDPQKIISLRQGAVDRLSFFMMGDGEEANYSEACPIAEEGIDVYCMSDLNFVQCPEHLHLVNREECLGRSYWDLHPLRRSEKQIALIGCEKIGSNILEKALLTNVFEASRTTEYHVFGNTRSFEQLHPELVQALSGQQEDEDRLLFHVDSWEHSGSVLSQADRIIICTDENEQNVQICEKLIRWFPLRASIHLYSTVKFPYVTSFGDRDEIMTREIVVRSSINDGAAMLNEIYNQNSLAPCPWEDLSPFLKQSNIAAADHLIIKIRLLLDDENAGFTAENCRKAYEIFSSEKEKRDLFQEIEHRRWMRFLKTYNWTYSETRDDLARTHPDLLPYHLLPESEQVKNAYSWEMLSQISEKLGKEQLS